jgi:UPF0271 protein
MRPGDKIKFAMTTDQEAATALEQLQTQAKETKPTPGFVSYKLQPRAGDGLKEIDLNADGGEGYDDEALAQYVTSFNIATGGHTGDAETMARTVALAVKNGVAFGAQPSYVDKEGWGRRALDVDPHVLRDQVVSQVSALMGIAEAYGGTVRYLKPHGALYHATHQKPEHTKAVREAARILNLPLMLMPKSPYATFGEGFAERAYDGDSLRPRDKPGAVIHDPALAAQQGLDLAENPKVHSICIHSDSDNAVEVAKAVRSALDSKYTVKPFVSINEFQKRFRPQFGLVPRHGDGLRTVDLNADAGEGFADEELCKYVTSVNVACGGHVGDSQTMAEAVNIAKKAGVTIGAQPSYMDKEGFGRRKLDTEPELLRNQVIAQVSALMAIAKAHGTEVKYLKPHGALYHTTLSGGPQAEAVREAAAILKLPLMLMPKSPWATYGEGFAERAYDGDSLRPRDKPGAVTLRRRFTPKIFLKN